MKIAIVFNPKAGSASRLDEVRRHYQNDPAVSFLPLNDQLDLRALAANSQILAVAGGDGTIHAVVEALAPSFPRTPLALLPLGTGNDLCRTMAVPLEPLEAAAILDRRRRRRRHIDVIRVEGDHAGWLINAATGGFSGKVASEVTSDLKEAWGPLAYLRGAIGVIAEPPSFRISLSFDGRPAERIDAFNVVIANGRTAAGGVLVSPASNPEDGRLDVVVIRSAPLLDHAVVAARLVAGDYHSDESVLHRRAKVVKLECDQPIPMSFDGELVEGGRRFTFSVERNAAPMIVGPKYRRNDRGGFFRRAATGFLSLFAPLRRMSLPVVLGAAAVIAFILLSVAVKNGDVASFNSWVREWVMPLGNQGLTTTAKWLTLAGDGFTLVPVIALLVVFRRRIQCASRLATAMAALVPLELLLKALFEIERPGATATWLRISQFSYPSGHALRITAICFALGWFGTLIPGRCRWVCGLAAFSLASGVCWSRVYLNVHWPTDVLGGALLGLMWAAASIAACPESTAKRS